MISKLALNIILFAIMAGGVGFVYYKIDKGGYDRRDRELLAATAKLESEASYKIEEIRNEHDKRIKAVYSASESDNGPVAPVLERTLDGLRQRHGGKGK